MSKKIIQRFLPSADHIHKNKQLTWLFGHHLRRPELWHLNRRSVAGAFAVGIFVAFLPIPLQMVAAGLLAIVLRVHLLISVVLVWITNPVTIVPLYLLAYRLGARFSTNPEKPPVNVGLQWFLDHYNTLLLGCLLLGITAASLSYLLVSQLWRLHIVQRWKERRRRKNQES